MTFDEADSRIATDRAGVETPPAIEIDAVSKSYGAFTAVDQLSLRVPQGSFFGFLGPNGAGKTTTIRMLTGLAKADSGTIRVMRLSMPGDEFEIRKQIGLVPDDTLLFDHLTGREYLKFVARMYGIDRPTAEERADELLVLFELDAEERKLAGEYSKGMRKRLAMSAALIHRPRVYLMDEPFEGVDAVGARLMKNILLQQVQRGATVFLTSHVLEVVERLCDSVAIINKGRIVVQGSIDEVRARAEGGREGLEEIFVRAVGGDARASLDWL